MTAAELMWLAHEEHVSYLHEHDPRKLRRYLMEVGDERTLRAFDLSKLRGREGESGKK